MNRAIAHDGNARALDTRREMIPDEADGYPRLVGERATAAIGRHYQQSAPHSVAPQERLLRLKLRLYGTVAAGLALCVAGWAIYDAGQSSSQKAAELAQLRAQTDTAQALAEQAQSTSAMLIQRDGGAAQQQPAMILLQPEPAPATVIIRDTAPGYQTAARQHQFGRIVQSDDGTPWAKCPSRGGVLRMDCWWDNQAQAWRVRRNGAARDPFWFGWRYRQ